MATVNVGAPRILKLKARRPDMLDGHVLFIFCVCTVPFFVICQRAAPLIQTKPSPYPHLLFPPSYPLTSHFFILTFFDIFIMVRN